MKYGIKPSSARRKYISGIPIDKSNRERTTVTLREYITLTATLDGKKLPKGTRCDWSAVEGGEYFKLDSIDNKPDQVIVNINTLAKARQTLKVRWTGWSRWWNSPSSRPRG